MQKPLIINLKERKRQGDRYWFNNRWMTYVQISNYCRRKRVTSAAYNKKNKEAIAKRKLKHYTEHKTKLNRHAVEMRKTGKWKKKKYSKEYVREHSKAYYWRNRDEVLRKLKERRALKKLSLAPILSTSR